jgi:hypothetical protein
MHRPAAFLLVILAAVSPAGADDWADDLWNEGKTRVAPFEAPRHEITPWIGWQFGGRAVFESGDLYVGDAVSFGAMLSYRVESQGTLELLVTHHPTTFRFRGGPLGETRTTDVGVTYAQFGGIRETNRGRVRPFGAFSLGLTILDPADADFSTETRFSFVIGGGVKAWWTRSLGVRLQANWLATVVGGSATVFCGSWGCFTTLSGEVISQGNVTAGLVFGF